MTQLIIAAALLFTIGGAVVNAEEVQLRLNPGNNLVSVPLTVSPTLTAGQLGQICQSAFVAEQGKNGSTCSVLGNTPIDPAKGYIIHCQNPDGLVVSLTGTVPTTNTISLRRGLNWVGLPQGVPLGATAQDLMAAQGLSVVMDTCAEGSFRTALTTGQDFFLENGRGLLVVSSTARTITLTPGTYLTRGSAIALTKALTSPVGGSNVFMTTETGSTWSTPQVVGPISVLDLQPSFSRTDPNMLALASKGDCVSPGIFLIDIKRNASRRLTGKSTNGACGDVAHGRPCLNNSGSSFLFDGLSTFPGSKYNFGLLEIMVTTVSGGPLFITPNINETAPVFYPNERFIDFLSDRNGKKQIWSVPKSIGTTSQIDDSRLALTRLVSDLPISEDRLAVSPDGTLYCGSNGQIYAVDPSRPADSNFEPITDGPNDSYASVSPNGARIAFIRDGRQLWVANWRGKNATDVYDSDTDLSYTTWRP